MYTKAVDAGLPRNLQQIVHALGICGRRWDLARRYEIIVQTAMAEHEMPVLMSSLPLQFFDLQYSTLDIDEALRVWVETLLPKLGHSTGSTTGSGSTEKSVL